MRHTLHVINGSHPCATVLRALELKGIDVKIVEYMPPLHPPILKLRFGSRTVPILVLSGGEVVRGSRQILQRLDAIQPHPPLYPREHVVAIEEAERWGDEELQPLARRMLWWAMKGSPSSLVTFQAGSHLPSLPRVVVRAFAPFVFAGEFRLNGVNKARAEIDAAALPGMLDRLEEFKAAGAFGTTTPTAADLQIGSSLQLLRAIDDLRPLIDSYPIARESARWLPTAPGRVAAGALSKDLVQLAVTS